VKVTVDSVQVHSAINGWATVSSIAKTYDLLQLKATGNQVLLADVQLKEGTYDQVRLYISKVVVTDAQGEQDAKLPSSELKIVGNLVVKANTTSTVVFDFVADESLRVTGNSKYIMAPVVKLETRERANVSVENDGRVKITGGNVMLSSKFGMDIKGNVGIGINIPADANIIIGSGGVLQIGGDTQAGTATGTATGTAGAGTTAATANGTSVGATGTITGTSTDAASGWCAPGSWSYGATGTAETAVGSILGIEQYKGGSYCHAQMSSQGTNVDYYFKQDSAGETTDMWLVMKDATGKTTYESQVVVPGSQ